MKRTPEEIRAIYDEARAIAVNAKWDLCENEIQCDEHLVAYTEHHIFDEQDKLEFDRKLIHLGQRAVRLVECANACAGVPDPEHLRNLIGEAFLGPAPGILTDTEIQEIRRCLGAST